MSVAVIIPISGNDPDFQDGNLPTLHDKSLIGYTLRAAQEATRLDRIIVSTDSEHIAEFCRDFGVNVPFLRPQELANPHVPVTEVLRYTLDRLQADEGYHPDWTAMMFITYPFRPSGFVDGFIQTVLAQELDSAFAAVEERYAHWFINENNQPNIVAFGSDTAKEYKRPFFQDLSGLISMAISTIIQSGSLYGQKLGIIPTRDMWATINVHDAIGAQFAEVLAPLFPDHD